MPPPEKMPGHSRRVFLFKLNATGKIVQRDAPFKAPITAVSLHFGVRKSGFQPGWT